MTSQIQKIIKSMGNECLLSSSQHFETYLGIISDTTEKLICETEKQLLILEDLVKEADFEKRVKEYECKASLLREEKMTSMENLQSIHLYFTSFEYMLIYLI